MAALCVDFPARGELSGKSFSFFRRRRSSRIYLFVLYTPNCIRMKVRRNNVMSVRTCVRVQIWEVRDTRAANWLWNCCFFLSWSYSCDKSFWVCYIFHFVTLTVNLLLFLFYYAYVNSRKLFHMCNIIIDSYIFFCLFFTRTEYFFMKIACIFCIKSRIFYNFRFEKHIDCQKLMTLWLFWINFWQMNISLRNTFFLIIVLFFSKITQTNIRFTFLLSDKIDSTNMFLLRLFIILTKRKSLSLLIKVINSYFRRPSTIFINL